jgi:hypothetical protein
MGQPVTSQIQTGPGPSPRQVQRLRSWLTAEFLPENGPGAIPEAVGEIQPTR